MIVPNLQLQVIPYAKKSQNTTANEYIEALKRYVLGEWKQLPMNNGVLKFSVVKLD